jgi:hypothetical protein
LIDPERASDARTATIHGGRRDRAAGTITW